MKTSSYLLAGSVDDLSFWVRENFDERHQTFWGGGGGESSALLCRMA